MVDSSALLAILYREPDHRFYIEALTDSARVCLSAANWVEASICVDRAGGAPLTHHFDELLNRAGIEMVPVTEAQARLAREAYRMFGKGNGHPAQLNFGDCFSYALAKLQDDPLLFKGQDFIHTDVVAVTSG